MRVFWSIVAGVLLLAGLSSLMDEPSQVNADLPPSHTGVITTTTKPLPPLPGVGMDVEKIEETTEDHDLYEPNDSPSQAYGPLASSQTYAAYIWDETDDDYYYYFVPTAGRVNVALSHIPADCDYDLYVYYYYDGAYQDVAHSITWTNRSEHVTFVAVLERTYYIRVYRYDGFSNLQPYHLVVEWQSEIFLPLVMSMIGME